MTQGSKTRHRAAGLATALVAVSVWTQAAHGAAFAAPGPAALRNLQRAGRASTRCLAAKQPAEGYELVRGEEKSVVTGPLTPVQIDEFYREGFLILRSVLGGSLLDRARTATLKCDLKGTEYDTLAFNAWQQDPVWLEVAQHAPIVQAVAQLTPLVASGKEDLHVAKDAVFVFKGDVDNPGKAGCDWHIDDPFFWPAALDANGPGINVWLALDPVTADGGGMCVAARSHTADFLDCRTAIRGGGTCDMARVYAAGRDRLEASCVRPELEPGDAIVHTRFLFHRTDPFRKGSEALRGPGVRRYTVRYMPSSARMTGYDRKGLLGQPVWFSGQQIQDLDPLRFPRVQVARSSGN